MRTTPAPDKPLPFAFCEPVTAGSFSRWHIRPLTLQGRKEGGGADTPALCGQKVAWDLGNPDVAATLARDRAQDPELLHEYCPNCLSQFALLPPPSRTL
jgi:hypothetical protein